MTGTVYGGRSGGEDLFCQLMFFHSVTESQNGEFIGQAPKLFKLRKLSVQRGVKEGLLHGGVRQREPLLLCKWMRSIVNKENGGCPVRPSG